MLAIRYVIPSRFCGLIADFNQMMPHQSQGACMAIEDAAALGILFSPKYFRDIDEALTVYNEIRLPRVTKVAAAAAKAAYNINERIGELLPLSNHVARVYLTDHNRLLAEQEHPDLQG
jgi:2-polyprenyl-6-methoxyphenol hydroxylase-like FAD-dependent oxidoreductase